MKRLGGGTGGASRTLLTTGAFAIAVPGALVAWNLATAGDEIHACYVPASGTVYLIKQPGLPETCRSDKHVEFSWSAQGEPGPQGPQGELGPQGEPGPQGPAGGIEGIRQVFQLSLLTSTDDQTNEVRCAEDEIALSGFYNITKVFGQPPPPVAVYLFLDIQDVGGGPSVGWRASAAEIVPTEQEWGVVVGAMCAPAPSGG